MTPSVMSLRVSWRPAKKGEFTLKLTITKNGDIGLKIDDSHKATVPQPNSGSTLFFVDEFGNMLRRDPRQGELFRPARKPRDDEDEKEETSVTN